MSERQNQYLVADTTIATLTYAGLLRHCAALPDSSKRFFTDIHPLSLDIDAGTFTCPSAGAGYPPVTVVQTASSLILSCECQAIKRKLCEHQVQVLYNIMEQPAMRIFFDAALRKKRIHAAAGQFGLDQEPQPEKYLGIAYHDKEVKVIPLVKGLLAVSAEQTEVLQKQLFADPGNRFDRLPAAYSGDTLLLILKKHKFYDGFSFMLAQAGINREGRIGNSVIPSDAFGRILESTEPAVTKFFAAVAAFGDNALKPADQSFRQGMLAILDNPLRLPAFYHDSSLATTITGSSLLPITLANLSMGIHVNVERKSPFYELSAALVEDGKAYALDSVEIKFGYFVKTKNRFHFISNPAQLRITRFFNQQNPKVLVHESRFNEFRVNILDELENHVTVSYAHHADPLRERLSDDTPPVDIEKIIYVAEHQNYIILTPVVKYGSTEIPVFSRKQAYATDANGNEYVVKRKEELEIHFISLLVRQHPEFQEQLEEARYLYLHKDRFFEDDWFLSAFEDWRDANITIFGYNEIDNKKRNPHPAKITMNVDSGLDWFNVTLAVKFGKVQATLKQIQRSIKNKSRFVRLDDGSLGSLPADWIKRLGVIFEWGSVAEELLRIPKSNFSLVQQLFEAEEISGQTAFIIQQLQEQLLQVNNLPPLQAPAGLLANLRSNQLQGVAWLYMLHQHQLGGCLADDMGLGKTLQVITFILLLKEKATGTGLRPSLVVVPASLLNNWQREIEKFAPSLKTFTHYGPKRQQSPGDFDKYDLILTSYGAVISDANWLHLYRFNYVILDESQLIKNPGSQRYKAVSTLQSAYRLVLTGTPFENSSFDIYAQLSFACPGLLGNQQHFRAIYSIPIDKFQNSKRAAELREKIQPFILRRTKDQVAQELPGKTELIVYCEMGAEQRAIYDDYEKEIREFIGGKTEAELNNNRMHVLTGLLRLRQICDAPVLLKTAGFRPDLSCKLDVLINQVENKSVEHKILIFSQFVSMLELVARWLTAKKILYETLTGKTKDKTATISRFQESAASRVMLISLKAGGLGTNLTEADYVYLLEPWWNPAVENQAIDRCYRIGQKKNVIAVRLVCKDTVEEKMLKLQRSKTKLEADLIQRESSLLQAMSKQDLLDLL